MSNQRLVLIIVAVAVVSIVAVVVASGGGDDDESADGSQQSTVDTPQSTEPDTPEAKPESEEAETPESETELPENPDDVRGTDDFSLLRPANLAKAIGVLDRRRQKVEGVLESIRVAPGRIDTVIVHPDDRRTNIQIRPDLKIASDFTHDFPTRPDFRKGGLTGRDVDTALPAMLLREFDGQRSGNASKDVDYCVISKDIIDFKVNVSCYMRIRTPRPRAFLKEAGEPLRVIG